MRNLEKELEQAVRTLGVVMKAGARAADATYYKHTHIRLNMALCMRAQLNTLSRLLEEFCADTHGSPDSSAIMADANDISARCIELLVTVEGDIEHRTPRML